MTDEYGRSASIEWASSIRPKKQVWLWDHRIPLGTASAWSGRGGTGKTTYVIDLYARLSRGELPGHYQGTPQRTLIWSGEDAWDTVLVPRLIAARANLDMVGRLSITSTVNGQTQEVTPRLPLDTDAFCKQVVDSGAVAVLIDPIASTMSGDLNREGDVRAAVDALARVAGETGVVMMFVRHFGKGGGNASDKMSGSHAFRDAVRSVFLFATDGDRVVVTQDKGNYAPPGDESFAFQLQNVTVATDDGPADVARVIELGTSDTSVADVINRAAEQDDDAGERTAAEHWLEDYLTENGATPSKTVKSEARKEGISEATLKRAKKKLGVLDRSEGFPRTSTWDLPSRISSEPTGATREPTEPTEPTGRDQHKCNEPTETISQSAHVPGSEPTGEPTDESPPHCATCQTELTTPKSISAGLCAECQLIARNSTATKGTVKPPRPTTCERCFVSLPAAATSPLCDDCDGAPEPVAQADRDEPPKPLHVVHDGRISKRDGGLDRHIRYFTPAPNGYPTQQTPKETA
ncbi:AAA family ATPase [Mycolicibacterium wolinskyi]|uniref:AAA family ATPase n=1 Tax=Mycolicibacterium wolinskyi TaxID=59750 RepID=UPI0039178895